MSTETIEQPPTTKRTYKRTKNTKVNPTKVANLLNNSKLSITDAAKVLNCSRNSIYNTLNRNEIDINRYNMEKLKNDELDELTIITHEARHHLYKLLQSGKLKGIETTAILDRTFQQRRELQGKGHTSVNIFTTIVQKADEDILKVVPVSTISSTPNAGNQPIAPDATYGTTDR